MVWPQVPPAVGQKQSLANIGSAEAKVNQPDREVECTETVFTVITPFPRDRLCWARSKSI